MRPTYCQPSEAGLASEGKAVARRLSKLLNALENEINKYVVAGAIEEDIWQFKTALLDKLRADGWRIENTDNGWKARLPEDYLK